MNYCECGRLMYSGETKCLRCKKKIIPNKNVGKLLLKGILKDQ